MSADPLPPDAPKHLARNIMIYLGVAVVAFGAGMLLEWQVAAQKASLASLAHEQTMSNAAAKAEHEKQVLMESLAKEREEHAKDIQSKDKHLAAFSSHAAGVRHALETDLSAARSSGDACTARIAGISEALGSIFDSIGEVTGIAQDLGRENQQLKEDNRSLADKLAGWQKWNAEQSQHITIVGKKNS